MCFLFDKQTADEQNIKHTRDTNNVGFNKPDAYTLTTMARLVKSGFSLDPNELVVVTDLIVKYIGQLERLDFDDKNYMLPPKNNAPKFLVAHNVKCNWGTDSVSVTFDYDESLKNLCRSFEGRTYNPDDKSWKIPYTKKNVEELKKHVNEFGQIPNNINAVEFYDYHIRDVNGKITIKSPYDETLKDIIKSLPPRDRQWDGKVWVVSRIGFNQIGNKLDSYIKGKKGSYKNEVSHLIQPTAATQQNQQPASMFLDTKSLYPCVMSVNPINTNTQEDKMFTEIKSKYPFLRNYQRVDVITDITNKNTLNANKMGLGKTIETGTAIDYLKPPKTLIIAPRSVCRQWVSELDKFFGIDAILIQDGKKRYCQYKDLTSMKEFVVVVNYDKVKIEEDKKAFFDIIEFDLVVFDEITYVKNYKSQIHKACKDIHAKRVYGLTGTPVENCVQDLFAIMSVVDDSFFGNFGKFADKYLDPGQWGGYVPKPNAAKMLGDDLAKFKGFIRWKQEDIVKELPELTQNWHTFKLDKQENELYNKILDGTATFTNREGKEMDLSTTIGTIAVLKVFVSDPGLYKNVNDIKATVASSKLKEFCDIVTDITLGTKNKIVCFSNYSKVVHDYEEKLKSLDINTIVITGEDTPIQREQKRNSFINMTEHCVCLCTDSMARGFNLQCAQYMINIDLPWNPSILEQRIGRIRRIGSVSDKVFVINLVAENTVEETIVKTIFSKIKTFDDIVTVNEKNVTELVAKEIELQRKMKKVGN